ncbi:uncharacterized protein LOC108632662 isoform X2 [Ceratina calcarata]|nr:uncharacterized protein LOC108632662 isoform X2 [Ceratina calcarata]
MPTPTTPFFSPECPLSNATNLRGGQTGQRSKSRVEAMLERALIQPQQCSVDPLYNAQSWGIPIWAIDKLQAWLDRKYASIKDTHNSGKDPRHPNQDQTAKELRVKHLKGPYLKFESLHRATRPVFVELSVWPTLNLNGDPGSCPFNSKKREKAEKLRKEVKENQGGIQTTNKEEDKEMTRRPRTTAARARRTEQIASGYCEICHIAYRDLSKHVQTDQHLSFVRNDDNFLSLDTLINAGANVEAFLKLNRGKDIEKDCNLFSNGDRKLHDTVLPTEGKVDKNATSLDDFEVGDDTKMVQYNGARRNLNLKLSSPHNLRTRAKHESGHLLRSKGSPWHEADKAEKFYDKFEGFTIKKRSKGTIWIEEDDPDEKFATEEQARLKAAKQPSNEYKIKSFSTEFEDNRCCDEETCDVTVCDKRKRTTGRDTQRTIICNTEENGIGSKQRDRTPIKNKSHDQINGSVKNGCTESLLSTTSNERLCTIQVSHPRVSPRNDAFKTRSENKKLVSEEREGGDDDGNMVRDAACNGHAANDERKPVDEPPETEKNGEAGKEEKLKCCKAGRRGVGLGLGVGGNRSVRGRHRLSVEERLIEDNRAYYKVEVLGNKLRSSALPNSNSQCLMQRDEDDADDEEKKEDVPSSEKPVVVRFKRVRKSELSLLSDEAESFMFGEIKREDSSEISDGEQSSVLPRDTESECNDSVNSVSCPSSFLSSSSPVKPDAAVEDDHSQDSLGLGRARKRRRTQAEALIKDNVDYYKFEVPGSRLRYQAPLTGIDEPRVTNSEQSEAGKPQLNDGGETIVVKTESSDTEKVYPSKPSPEVEKMQFSFEAAPKSEPWYQTYQRQDEGAEYWHYFSEGYTQKPFLLPYEIDNFHEILAKNQNSRVENKRKGRGGRSNTTMTGSIGRSPRKSPRCHASTLAIMSTIIRKREQQQQSTNFYTIDECQPPVKLQPNMPKPYRQKVEAKSDVEEELREKIKSIDEMFNEPSEELEFDEETEPDVAMQMELNLCEPVCVPRGPPPNLVELLENCHEMINYLENSSCASSECGETNVESSPLKRRKKRKNRTGWPGNKLKKRQQIQNKISTDANPDRGGNPLEKNLVQPTDKDCNVTQVANVPGRRRRSPLASEPDTNVNTMVVSGDDLDRKKSDERLFEGYTGNVPPNTRSEEDEGKVTAVEEVPDNSVSEVTTNVIESNLDVSITRNETDRNFVSNIDKDYAFGKHLSETEEISENDPGNDQNHENVFRKDVHSISDRRFIPKVVNVKKRQRDNNTSSESCDSRMERENQEIVCRKDVDPGIVSRKHHNNATANGLPRKRQPQQQPQKIDSENPDSEIEHRLHHHDHHHRCRHHDNVYKRSSVNSRKRIVSRKRPRNDVTSDAVYENEEHCKKDLSYLSITCKRQQAAKGMKQQQGGSVPSEARDSDVDCALSGRVTPAVVAPSELEHRRSSIEFQPVVRMMKIDDQVEMDHNNILSVTVASNRRLRSSSSPRSIALPPKKRLKTNRGQFGRWLKNS